MQQTFIFKPDEVGCKGELNTDQETYKTIKVVNTKAKLFLDVQYAL